MVDVLESVLEGLTDRSIIAAEGNVSKIKRGTVRQSTANLAFGQISAKWVCYNVSEHSDHQKVVVDQVMLEGREAVCPKCGRPLVKIDSVVSG